MAPPKELLEVPPCNGRDVIARLFGAAAVPSGANPGLVFDRYLRLWQRNRLAKDRFPSLEALCKQVETSAEKTGLQRDLSSRHQSHRRAVELLGGEVRSFATTTRLAIGLGAPHPLENGLTLDHTLGLPYIPGTAVKGMCRAFAQHYKGFDDSTLVEWFGTEPEVSPSQAGSLVFWPAHPTRVPRLEVDIVNCHHREYYERKDVDRGERAPGIDLRWPMDVERPVPVYFLTVAPGTAFAFAIGPRLGARPASNSGAQQVGAAFELLREGLEHIGIGAKTSAGYGYMTPR